MTTSFRDRALGDLTPDDVQRLLAESETLFVEHKSALRGGEQFQIVKAAASFANGLGGWIVVGVRSGEVVTGGDGEWQPPDAEIFVDQVREALDRQIDPPVPFAAMLASTDAGTVGIIRVHESVDTPHIVTQNGGIYVREVAKDRRTNLAGNDSYEPAAVRSQTLLLELARRGREARAAAQELLGPGACPWIDRAMGLRYDAIAGPGLQMSRRGAGAVLRLVPMTRQARMADWAVSQQGLEQLRSATSRIAQRPEANQEARVDVAASGVAVHDKPATVMPPLPDLSARNWHSTAAADSSGVIGLSINFGDPDPAPERYRLLRHGFRWLLIDPLVREGVRLLQDSEFFGRVHAELFLAETGAMLDIDEDGVLKPGPARLPLGGDIVVPSTSTLEVGQELDGELRDLANQWAADAARAVGHPVLR